MLLDRIKRLYRDGALDLGASLEPLRDPAAFQHLIDTLYAVDWSCI
jgi:hypothetical protein